jgi:hypothetical protein
MELNHDGKFIWKARAELPEGVRRVTLKDTAATLKPRANDFESLRAPDQAAGAIASSSRPAVSGKNMNIATDAAIGKTTRYLTALQCVPRTP